MLPNIASAWSEPGHMTIAAIAYRNLPDAEKANVNELLKHHPEYSAWKATYPTDVPNLDLETFIFMRSSTWADEIRRAGSPYDHPLWHYVDFPVEPPAFPDKPSPFPTNDVIYGIAQSEMMLSNTNTSLEERAAYLALLIHFVGDIHQPLHCCTLVTTNYPAPSGDRGGNSFFVMPNSTHVNLHSLWDRGLGGTVNPQTQYNYAIELSAAHPRMDYSELAAHTTPESWGKEGWAVAIQSVYLNGNLQGGMTRETAVALPEGYTANLKVVSERQAPLAGYRLATDISRCLKTATP
jgi:hypothetical protein